MTGPTSIFNFVGHAWKVDDEPNDRVFIKNITQINKASELAYKVSYKQINVKTLQLKSKNVTWVQSDIDRIGKSFDLLINVDIEEWEQLELKAMMSRHFNNLVNS